MTNLRVESKLKAIVDKENLNVINYRMCSSGYWSKPRAFDGNSFSLMNFENVAETRHEPSCRSLRPRNKCSLATGSQKRIFSNDVLLRCTANDVSENLPVGWNVVIHRHDKTVEFVTSDGVVIRTLGDAESYLEGKSVEPENLKKLLDALDFSKIFAERLLGSDCEFQIASKNQNGVSTRASNKRPQQMNQTESPPRTLRSDSKSVGKGIGAVDSSERQRRKAKPPQRDCQGQVEMASSKHAHTECINEKGLVLKRSRQHGVEGVAMMPSYLRSRFGDRGSSLVDTPMQLESGGGSPREGRDSPVCGEGGAAEGRERCGREVLEKCVAEMHRERDQRNTARRRRLDASATLVDNNVLLFGRWFRKRGREGSPVMEDLRDFVLDRSAYWGDEIALRVLADAFQVVIAVLLQAEERIQCIFPPGGKAASLVYLVLTHRGSVPHYRSVTVAGRHVLSLVASATDVLNPGMLGRLLEDCPDGWEPALEAPALQALSARAGGAEDPKTQRRSIVRDAHTLREVKSRQALQGGGGVETQAIEGFRAGTSVAERIACSPRLVNPPFAVAKTPGDGDCLFYAMADVANELRPTVLKHLDKVTAEALRRLVATSLSDDELAFFKAANNLD